MKLLRWLLVIPSFVVTVIVMRFIVLFFIKIAIGGDSFLYPLFEALAEGGIAVSIGLYAVTKIAPNNKGKAVYFVTALLCLFCLFVLALVIMNGYGFGDMPQIFGILTLILAMGTSIYFSYIVKTKGIEALNKQ